MSNNDSYTPVSCATHSEYELYIMHRKRLKVEWSDEQGNKHSNIFLPKDLVSKNNQEFLILEDEHGMQHRIRLDRIRNYQPA